MFVRKSSNQIITFINTLSSHASKKLADVVVKHSRMPCLEVNNKIVLTKAVVSTSILG